MAIGFKVSMCYKSGGIDPMREGVERPVNSTKNERKKQSKRDKRKKK